MTCTFMPCFLCLPEKKGRSAAIRSIGRSVPSRIRYAFIDAACNCFGERGGEGGQEFDGLGDVPVDSGGADPETGCELGVGLAVAEVGEGEQGLSARAQAPPPGPESAPAFLQTGDEEAQGRAGHVDAGRVDKHAKPLVETVLLVDNPSTRGFIRLSGQLAIPRGRLEKAQCLPV